MPAVPITRDDYDAAGLRALVRREPDAKVVRRLLAIASVLEGASREAAARAAGMDRQTLRDWVHRYNAGGPAALANRKAPGQPPSLDAEQTAQLAEWVRTGPDPARDGVVRWRRQDLAVRIQREFGVTLADRSVGAVLQRLGLKLLSVRAQHPQQDPEAVEAHKKTSPRW
jgi:transposase